MWKISQSMSAKGVSFLSCENVISNFDVSFGGYCVPRCRPKSRGIF